MALTTYTVTLEFRGWYAAYLRLGAMFLAMLAPFLPWQWIERAIAALVWLPPRRLAFRVVAAR